MQNRLDMELTGIQTPVGLKIQGPNVEGIQQAGTQLQKVLEGIPELRSVFAERVAEGFYVNVEVDRPEAARYGLTVADVQRSVSSGVGGENITENVEGRQRYPVNVRYSRDFRDDVEHFAAGRDRDACGCSDSHLAGGKGLLFPRPGYDPRRRGTSNGIRLSGLGDQGLWGICLQSGSVATGETEAASRLYLQMVRRIRIRATRTRRA